MGPPLTRRRFVTGTAAAGLAAAAGLTSCGGGSDTSSSATTALDADLVAPEHGHTHELVIAGGRVIDPETGTDTVADVGVDGGRVTAIAVGLEGRRRLEAAGHVVAPGFVDVLSYAPNPYGIWFKVADGVTTNLAMHGISARAEHHFDHYAEPGALPPIHHGGAASGSYLRLANRVGDRVATTAELDAMAAMLAAELDAGWIGLSLEPEYTPWASFDELVVLAEVATDRDVPVFVHARYSTPHDPGRDNAAAIDEVVRLAETTGAAVHVDHLTSTGGTGTMAASLATLEDARADGLDVTACSYPYTSWATYLGSARFAPGWQERFGLSEADLVVPGTGERLTPVRFEQLRAANALVAAQGAIPEADVRAALATPWLMVASDTILEPAGTNHPRGAGTFARLLGHYVRDEAALDLIDALAKVTVLPAQRMERACPAMRRKGRLQVGADADITIFDPRTIADTATLERPDSESVGVTWVLVEGQVVRSPEGSSGDVRPGRALRREG